MAVKIKLFVKVLDVSGEVIYFAIILLVLRLMRVVREFQVGNHMDCFFLEILHGTTNILVLNL